METKLDIGYKIKILREIKGISKKEIASGLNISQQAYQKIESGQTKITLERAHSISGLLGIEFESLINFNPANYLYQCTNSGIFNTNNIGDKNAFDKLIEAKDRIIEEQQKRIILLEQIIAAK